jgi:hypothetical protein
VTEINSKGVHSTATRPQARPAMSGNCKTCGEPFISRQGRQYCPRPECRRNKSPAVYRFVCPDGRSYVGAVGDSRKRGDIQRSNARLHF